MNEVEGEVGEEGEEAEERLWNLGGTQQRSWKALDDSLGCFSGAWKFLREVMGCLGGLLGWYRESWRFLEAVLKILEGSWHGLGSLGSLNGILGGLFEDLDVSWSFLGRLSDYQSYHSQNLQNNTKLVVLTYFDCFLNVQSSSCDVSEVSWDFLHCL